MKDSALPMKSLSEAPPTELRCYTPRIAKEVYLALPVYVWSTPATTM